MKPKIVILLSGGLDSSTLAYYLVENGWEVYALTILYGQRHSKELQSAQAIAKKLAIPLAVADISSVGLLLSKNALTGIVNVPDSHYTDETQRLTFVPSRNSIFLSIASAYALTLNTNYIAYAAHLNDQTIYPDCQVEYIRKMQDALTAGNYNPIVIIHPFTDKTKAGIVRIGLQLKVPFELTWSCYEGKDEACGKCGTCQERIEAFKQNNLVDPIKYAIPISWR